jgi:hypothetical protein
MLATLLFLLPTLIPLKPAYLLSLSIAEKAYNKKTLSPPANRYLWRQPLRSQKNTRAREGGDIDGRLSEQAVSLGQAPFTATLLFLAILVPGSETW